MLICTRETHEMGLMMLDDLAPHFSSYAIYPHGTIHAITTTPEDQRMGPPRGMRLIGIVDHALHIGGAVWRLRDAELSRI